MESQQEQPLLLEDGAQESENKGHYTGDGSVDINGNLVLKHCTGNWRASPFILGMEACERLAFYGIALNLVTYFTEKLHEGNVSAAKSVTTWSGTCYITPLIGAILADAYWGRYWTIAVSSTAYIIGLVTLTLSASIPALKPPDCMGSVCPEASGPQFAIFSLGLYLITLGTGGNMPCVSSFGADQFDDTDPKERVKKGSFFNWYYLFRNIGALVSCTFLVWVQDNYGWGLGFGIPAMFMCLGVVSFFAGTSLYRFQRPGGSPFSGICQVLVASLWKWNVDIPRDSSLLYELPDRTSTIDGSPKIEHTDELRFLDKAATITDQDVKTESFTNPWRLCTVTQVEELKILVRMFPTWIACTVFAARVPVLFIEQGMVMNTTVGSFTISPASLSTFDIVSIFILIPVYDRVLVPIAKRFTGKERGFSELQRMGIGLFLLILVMASAALVETARLNIARKYDLIDKKIAVPMSICWQIPQYFLLGAAEVFTSVGMIEFFYDQSPDAMRSLCSALMLLTTAFGNYLGTLILTVVTSLTTRGGKPGWIPDNLNEGHLDYFFWLLAGISFINLVTYAYFAKGYRSKATSRVP